MRGEGESVGEGEEVIISISSLVRFLPKRVRGENLFGELAWARKVRAYLYRRVKSVCWS